MLASRRVTGHTGRVKFSFAAHTPSGLRYDSTTKKFTLHWASPPISIELPLDFLLSVLAYLPDDARRDFAARLQQQPQTAGAVIEASEPVPAPSVDEVVPWEPVGVADLPQQALYDRLHTAALAFRHVLDVDTMVEGLLRVALMLFAYAEVRDADAMIERLNLAVETIEEEVPHVLREFDAVVPIGVN